MLLLLPALLLLLGLPALLALHRWRPASKSYWFVAVGGSLLASLALLALRFGLPRPASLAGWRVGAAEFPLSLELNELTWPLGFALAALLLARLLGSVRRASQVKWPAWMPALALTAAGLPAATAGDLLTAALALFLMDALALGLHVAAAPQEERAAIVERFGLNAGGVLLVLLAWAVPPSYAELGNWVLLAAGGLRLAQAAKAVNLSRPAPGFGAALRLAPQAAALGLLLRVTALEGVMLHFALAALFALAAWGGAAALKDTGGTIAGLHLGLSALSLAAAAAGAPAAVLGFGLLLLFSESLVELAARFPRARMPLTALVALLSCGLPFTPLGFASQQYAGADSPLIFALLLPHALLLLSLLLRAGQPAAGPAPDEPWTLAIETGGALLGSLVFLLLGLLTPGAGSPPAWPGAAVLALAAALFALRRRGRSLLPPRLRALHPPRLRPAGGALASGLDGLLRLPGVMLEGEAGLLWALLFIALLISILAQTGLAG